MHYYGTLFILDPRNNNMCQGLIMLSDSFNYCKLNCAKFHIYNGSLTLWYLRKMILTLSHIFKIRFSVLNNQGCHQSSVSLLGLFLLAWTDKYAIVLNMSLSKNIFFFQRLAGNICVIYTLAMVRISINIKIWV